MGSSDLTLRSSNTKHKKISKTNYTSRYKLTLLSQLLTAEFRKRDLNKETPRTSFGALSVWTVTEVTRRTSTQQHAQLVWPLCSLKFKLIQQPVAVQRLRLQHQRYLQSLALGFTLSKTVTSLSNAISCKIFGQELDFSALLDFDAIK